MLLNEMEIFYYVVKLTSFSKAARQLNVSNSHISKKVDKLETELEAKLLTRTTRRLTLTEVGKTFYEHCARLVEDATEGYAAVSELRDEPFGLLKITAPPAFTLSVLPPIIVAYMKRYPRVKVRLELETRASDIISEGFDLAIRAIPLKDSNLIGQKLFEVESILVATPKYLKQYGKPRTPAELESHHMALYGEYRAQNVIEIDHQAVPVDIYFESNNLHMIRQMTLDSLCMSLQPLYMVAPELKHKQLVQVLEKNQFSKITLYAVYPEREFMPLKLRLFLEMLKQHL